MWQPAPWHTFLSKILIDAPAQKNVIIHTCISYQCQINLREEVRVIENLKLEVHVIENLKLTY